MQKINSFKILNVVLQGFKCFKDTTKFVFGDMTLIKGANGLGKSSIADAISFAFTGTPFFGEKCLDKLYSPNTSELEVSINFVDEKEQTHNIIRTRKNDASIISFDGYNVRQKDMNEAFGDGDLFLSMFNPLYFIDTLGADGKEMLEKMLPFVEHETVLASLSDSIKRDMENEKILSPETYIKKRREEIREQEENLIYLQGQSDLRNSEMKKAEKALEQTTDSIAAVDGQICKLEAQRDNNWLSADDTEQLTELYRRLDELTADKQDKTAVNEMIKTIYSKELELGKLNATVYQSPYTAEIAEKDSELKHLYKEYAELNAFIKNLQKGYKCLTCFHEITDDNLPATKNELQEKLKQCVAAGSKAKLALEKVKKQDNADRQAFEAIRTDAAALLENQLLSLKSKCEAIEADRLVTESEHDKAKQAINDEIQFMEYRKDNGNLTPEQIQELKNLRQKKRDLSVQLEMYQTALVKPGFSEQIKATEKEINRLKLLISNAVIYIGKKNELIFKDLNMNRVKISLYDVVKSTGEIKDTFKFTYDGREYKRLSLSEKVRAGLEISELIKKLSGKNFPTFIDNSESVCIIDNVRPTSQLIFSVVEKGRPLTVTYTERTLRKAG